MLRANGHDAVGNGGGIVWHEFRAARTDVRAKLPARAGTVNPD
jgi:hypothetical protein